MNIKELDYPSYAVSAAPRVSWLAVFAGAATAVAVTGCLGLLGLGMGFVHVPAGGILSGLRTTAAAWMIVSTAAAFYAGGWVAGRMAGLGRLSDSVVHGAAAWAAATTALLALFPAVGAVFSPVGLTLAPAAVVKFGWTGFLLTAVSCATACAGARGGTRLLKPVPIDQYGAKKRETVPAGL